MEIIKLNVGVEQDIIISYNNIVYRFELKFNDYFEYWFIDIFLDETDELIQAGIKLLVDFDCFLGLGLKLGKLYIIDSNENGGEYNIKTDLGDRLKLVREI